MSREPMPALPARPATRRRAITTAASLAAALLAGGCASPSPPPSFHSVVAPAGRTVPAAASAAPAPTVAIGRIVVPDAVDRPALVVESPAGPALLDGQRWIEPLKSQLPRALALLLTERLPAAAIVAWPSAPAAPAWRLTADVQRFELDGGAQPTARLRVVWSLRAGEGPAAAYVHDAAVAADGSAPAALVAAMRQALAGWADAVAERLRAPG